MPPQFLRSEATIMTQRAWPNVNCRPYPSGFSSLPRQLSPLSLERLPLAAFLFRRERVVFRRFSSPVQPLPGPPSPVVEQLSLITLRGLLRFRRVFVDATLLPSRLRLRREEWLSALSMPHSQF